MLILFFPKQKQGRSLQTLKLLSNQKDLYLKFIEILSYNKKTELNKRPNPQVHLPPHQAYAPV